MTMFDSDVMVVDSVDEVKHRRFRTKSEQNTFNTVECKSGSGTPFIERNKILLEQTTVRNVGNVFETLSIVTEHQGKRKRCESGKVINIDKE